MWRGLYVVVCGWWICLFDDFGGGLCGDFFFDYYVGIYVFIVFDFGSIDVCFGYGSCFVGFVVF